jgi:[protein-PII] uridylyltransferase
MSAVAQPSTGVARLRLRFGADKNTLLEGFAAARPSAQAASALTRGLARLVDATLAELWIANLMPPSAALVACGGYGRGELFPHSDVDVLVLVPDDAWIESARAAIERFIGACWDIGLEIGSAVRTIDDCAAESVRDVTVQTALLESRLVTGPKRLFVSLRERLGRDMDARAFFRAKTLEMRQRHTKYADTPYSLEPNCKESPGGLRDLQILLWVARAAGLGRSWRELAAKGLATPFEVKQLQRNEGVLKMIRARLHVLAGRREDRLVFDLQTAVAESFGLRSQRGQRASELLMRRYYWAAKAVVQLNQILLLNIEERLLGREQAPMRPLNVSPPGRSQGDALPSGDGAGTAPRGQHVRFFDRDGMIEVASDDLYAREPHAILETFLVYTQTVGTKGLSARTLRALYNARHLMNARFRSDPVNRARFIQILQQEAGQTHALRLMNQTSVLGRYLWVFRRIVGQMQHDLFHVYTVDQHILMVVRNVRRFFIAEHTHEYPFCSQLAADFERPYVLYVAALFHDVAKGRGGDHSQLGASEVRRFCRDHRIPADDARLIEFLVRQHLTMSHTAQKEDLSDPDVIAAFARIVGDVRTLTALYLLTVADIRGTSPKVWNAWKGKLLEDLYRLARRVLSAEGGAQPNAEAEVEHRKAEARALLALASQLPDTEKPLWDTMDVGYFMRHDPADLAWHARVLWRHVRTARPIASARASPLGEGLQVLVYAPDVPDLFARICGYFDNAGFSVLDAKVHTSRTGFGLDTFQLVHPQIDEGDQGAYRDLISLVETQLLAALASAGPLPEPRRGRVSRRVKSFPITPRVTLRPDERAQRWILTVSASDRTGLLYSLARVLAKHRINLQLAKISTLGERVEDTFLVDGAPLQHNKTQLAIESELLDALAAPTA